MKRIAAALALAGLAMGCSKPYDPAVVDPQNAQRSTGLERHLADSTGTLHAIWSHGMCPHDERWAAGRLALVSRVLGASGARLEPAMPEGGHQRAILSVPDPDGARMRNLVIDFVYYSDLFDNHRRRLCFDSDPAVDSSGASQDACRPTQPPTPPSYERLAMQRAALNETLKSGILNACLVDAVAYLGAPGEDIRRIVAERVRRAISTPVGEGAAPVVFITESLGSKVVGDAIATLFAAGAAQPSPPLGEARAWMLLSNQIPLLDTAGLAPPGITRRVGGGQSIGAAIDALAVRSGRRALRATPFEIVAFTDPNDILSYRLPPGYIRLESGPLSLSNLLVSNDWTYFSWAENPGTAHPGYARNPEVMEAMVCGIGSTDAACKARVRRRFAAGP